MNLLEIRKKFIELSGRYDLVNKDYSDNGANFFITEGARYLDRLTETQKSYGSKYLTLAVGAWNVQFPYCRAVKSVYAASTTAKWQLEPKEISWMIANIFDELASGMETGTPLYYAPIITRVIGTPPTDIASYIDTISSSGEEYNAMLILPITSTKLIIEVDGTFFSDSLSNDSDQNFWSVTNPSTLIKSALRELEVYNQNKSKTDSWTQSILEDLDGINKDLVNEEISGIDQIED